MKTIRNSILIIITGVFILNATSIKAQDNNLKKMAYKAYLSNSVKMWKSVEAKARKKYEANPNNFQMLLKLTDIQYGLLNACVANKGEDTHKKYLKMAEKNVDTLLHYNNKWSAAHALKAGILSSEMAFNPAKGMILGPKNQKHIEKALKYNNKEPLAWIQKGNTKLHSPKMFGGDTEEAINAYKKAIEIFEQDSTGYKNNWQYINTLAWLGYAYSKEKEYEKALSMYQKALRIEPEFNWVKYNLIKKVKQKLSYQ
jgi:tetratricopeptide (TPR) repeat protein